MFIHNVAAEEKKHDEYFLMLERIFDVTPLDNLKIIKALFCATNDIHPLLDGSSKTREKDCIAAYISHEEVLVLTRIYKESRRVQPDLHYEIVEVEMHMFVMEEMTKLDQSITKLAADIATSVEYSWRWFMWEELELLESNKKNKLQQLEVMTMMSFDGSDQGWALICKGSSGMARAKADLAPMSLTECVASILLPPSASAIVAARWTASALPKILESCKLITVGAKLAQPSLEYSFRRNSRGGVEQDQFNELSALVHDVSLISMADRWKWDLESSGDFSVASVRKIIDDKSLSDVDSKTRVDNICAV
ncbi:RNA-directed DNA polymerase, eukaryota, reverse transcriptase zinc-binding domain protein [Tanacetum coccineum]